MNNHCRFLLFSILASVSFSLFAQTAPKPKPGVWYHLITRYNGTDDRVGRAIEVAPPETAHADTLWSTATVDASDPRHNYQCFRFEQSPTDTTRYAMICRAYPDGYVRPIPTDYSMEGRWVYVISGQDDAEKYGFTFSDDAQLSGIDALTRNFYCAISTAYGGDSHYTYMNIADATQNYAINVSGAAAAGRSNEWLFNFIPHVDKPSAIDDIVDDESDDPAKQVYYDLQGRRVASPVPGQIYVSRGKKVLFIP